MPRLTEIRAANSEALSGAVERHPWLEWAPLVALPAGACIFRSRVAAWQFLWLLSFAIFWGCKWQTWLRAREVRTRASFWRSLGYLLFWPGMDARSFFDDISLGHPQPSEWLAAGGKTLAGIGLIALAARNSLSVPPLIAGWLGLSGLVLLLHFGTFHILALIYQSARVNAERIMRAPLRSMSLSEFWGRRWNRGFRELAHSLVFVPLRKRFGPPVAGLAAFFVSGLIHDLVISFPARSGYGRPTAYFLVQGAGTLFERSAVGKRLGLGRGVRGWFFGLLVVSGPAFLLFHPPFVRRVMLPFLAAIGSLFGWH